MTKFLNEVNKRIEDATFQVALLANQSSILKDCLLFGI